MQCRHSRISRLCQLAACVTLAAAPVAVGGCAAKAAGTLEVVPIEIEAGDPPRRRFGDLEYRGGLRLRMADSRFGGYSGLHVSDDGQVVTAVSDRGSWFRARPVYDEADWLIGLTDPEIQPLLGPDGTPLTGADADAESLAPLEDGRLLVTFERRHRMLRYPGPDPIRARPVRVPLPFPVRGLKPNEGLEATTRLCDGRRLFLAETRLPGGEGVPAWTVSGREFRRHAYGASDGFVPTGATTAPDCSVYIVERRFRPPVSLAVRVSRVAPEAIAGETLQPETLATFALPQQIDNFEGIAARGGEAGETLLYIVSDDNFSRLQQTLLLMFAVTR